MDSQEGKEVEGGGRNSGPHGHLTEGDSRTGDGVNASRLIKWLEATSLEAIWLQSKIQEEESLGELDDQEQGEKKTLK